MKTTETIETKTASKAIANKGVEFKTRFPLVDTIQTKLNIGQPGNKYETEVDRMADSIMSMPEPTVQHQVEEEEEFAQTKPFIQTQTFKDEGPLQAKWIQREVGMEEEQEIQDETIRQQEEEEELIQPKAFIQAQPVEEEEIVQTKNNNESDGFYQSATPWAESRIQSSAGNGSTLPKNTKSFMENRFGSDFEAVRIHTDSNAVEMNRQLNAQAFTVGSDVYFNTGKYSPDSSSGKHLLAHELTHVIQQGSSTALKRKPIPHKKESTITNTNNHLITKKPRSIQRGIMDDLRSMGTAVVNVVTSVAQTVGSGLRSALSWIRSVGSLIGGGIELAWNWTRNVARTIGVGVRTAVSWVRSLRRIVGLGAREAFNWIRNISRHIGMGIRSAFSWLTNISNLIGSGIRDAYAWIRNVARGIGSGFRPSWSWVLSVARHIGQGIRSAWSWVNNMAGIIGLGLRAAWNWVLNLSRSIGMGIITAFQWIMNVTSRIALGVLDTLVWLRNLGRMLHAGLREAWNFILRVASILAITVLDALVWLRRVAQRIGRSLRRAWEIIQRIADRIGRTVVRTWEWLREVARRIGQRILAAWEWIQNVARLIHRTLEAAWNFVVGIARSIGGAISRFLEWLRAPLPIVIIGNFKNTGSTSSKNNCDLCPLPLGQSTTHGTNGMELRGDIYGHNPLLRYDFKRTKERATWKLIGTSWTQLTHVGPGADDDSHNQDEDLTPDSNQIYVIDTPGFRNKSNPVRDHSAGEAVYKASFVETVKAKKIIGSWTTISNSFRWHSISWFENVSGSWQRKAGSNEIETGSTTVGSGDP